MTASVVINGESRPCSTVEVRAGRLIVDGNDVTPEGAPVIQIIGNVDTLLVDGKSCVAVTGHVRTQSIVHGSIGKVVSGNAVFGDINMGRKR